LLYIIFISFLLLQETNLWCYFSFCKSKTCRWKIK